LERGGDLAAVHRWALQRLDSTHLDVLHRMTHEIDFVRVSGHRVGVVALELGRYVDELAPLVSRCLDLYELPLLFALFGEGDHVTLIARGRVPGVEVGQLVAPFGGGGHATAAAARVAGRTVLEVREELLAHLAATLPPAARAGDLAIADFVVVAAGTTVADAKVQLVERRVNAAPVAAPGGDGQAGGLSGAVTRQLLDAALQHGLGERPVERVMSGGLEWVAADAPAEAVAERMLERHPRFVLVGDPAAGRAEGLITRMQVMRHLHARLAEEELSLDRAEHLRTRKESAGKLLALLPPPLDHQVAAARRVARREGIAVYVVGGPVRDLLLAAEGEAATGDAVPRSTLPRDLDLVVEGDGPHFAHLLAAELDGRVREHRTFLTAVVIDPDGRHVDVATARSEFYRQPAALPEVSTSALRQDLYRRDFTINTLVIRLGPGDEPALLDHFGGRRDLDEGTIRVLHSLSFIDDPTRALRAVRLEQRLGFEIAPETLHLMRVAHEEGAFDRLSGSRLREELKLLLDDPAVALRGLERLDELGLTPALDPALVLGAALRTRLRAAVGAYHWFRFEGLDEPQVELWLLLLVALADSLPGAEDGEGDGDEAGEGESAAERFAARLML
ncbi:MAG TPA: CBS domain-containing protein, partial [Thermoanaerobaculia bacterium]|nr:CBS domain-containing protein [Thermoanaerobaculia bacterium]